MPQLAAREGVAARAVQFAILTACRSGEVRGATRSEIDMDARVWTVPAKRMKAGKEHRVPLSTAAIAVLQQMPRISFHQVIDSAENLLVS
jgi:integrase